MNTKPLIDRSNVDQIIEIAKMNRARFLRQNSRNAASAVRWGAVGSLVTICITFFVSHGVHARLG